MRTEKHPKLRWLASTLCLLAAVAYAQEAKLEPNHSVERAIAGGESHAYQLQVTAGQFLRVVVEQKAVDVALVLAAPDGKKVVEVNFTAAGGLESLSAEAAASGDYQLTVRAAGSAALAGFYHVRLEVKAAATAQDRQRLAAEQWMLEANELRKQGAKTAEQAIDKLQQALSVWREMKDRANEGAALNSLGVASRNLGRYEKAIEYFEQALAISREVKDRAGEGIALSNLGVVYYRLSHYEKAIERSEQALAIHREVKDRANEGIALNNLGLDYDNLGRYEQGIGYYEQALAISRKVKDRAGEGRTLNNLGIAYANLGRQEKAIESYEQALTIHREVKDRAVEGIVLNNLGIAHKNLGRYEQGIGYYEQALAISREVKDRTSEGRALNSLGTAYEKLGRYEKAIGYSEQALEIRREVKDRAGEAYSLYSLARAERSQGNLLAARTYIEESLKIAESLRSDLLSPASRASFLANAQNSYQLYTDVLMRQHRAEPTKGFAALAVEVSERQRARSLLDLLSEARADMRLGVGAALIERERALTKQLNDKARATAATKEAAAALKLEISQLETELERAQAAIRKDNPRYAALVQPRPLKLAEIQAQLDADTLLLEYALGEERSYLWAITKDSLTSYELPKEEQIKQRALAVYELLTARSTSKPRETVAQQRQRFAQADTHLAAAAQALSQ